MTICTNPVRRRIKSVSISPSGVQPSDARRAGSLKQFMHADISILRNDRL